MEDMKKISTVSDLRKALICSLCNDLVPLLQFSCGDWPSAEHKATTQIVAQLTVQYIERLVRAAVDAQVLLLDGKGGQLPICPFLHIQRPRRDDEDETIVVKRNNVVMNWELPLPGPVICNSGRIKSSQTVDMTATDHDPMVQGIDFFSKSRTEDAFRYPCSNWVPMNVECFLFPIYHDAALYGRIRDLLHFRSLILPSSMERQSNVPHASNSTTEEHDQNQVIFEPGLWDTILHESHGMLEQSIVSSSDSNRSTDRKKHALQTSPHNEELNKIKKRRLQLASRTGRIASWPMLDRQDDQILVPVYKGLQSSDHK